MMAKGHVTVGICVVVAGSLFLHNWADLVPLTVGTTVGALWPDMDTADNPQSDIHSARITHVLGPVSTGMSRVITKTSGGHRQATHSPVAVLVEGGVLYVLGVVSPIAASIVAIFLMIAFFRGVMSNGRSHSSFRGLFALIIGVLVGLWLHSYYPLLILSFVIGNFSHLLADYPCGHMPLAWPISEKRTYKRYFVVDSPQEHEIIAGVWLLTAVFLAFTMMIHLGSIEALVHEPTAALAQVEASVKTSAASWWTRFNTDIDSLLSRGSSIVAKGLHL